MWVNFLIPLSVADELVTVGFYGFMITVINLDLSVVVSLFYRYSQVGFVEKEFDFLVKKRLRLGDLIKG
jgi:hypothetical protein